MTARPRATAILNPRTGRRRAEVLENLLQGILERRFDLRIVRSSFAGEERMLARQFARDSDIVIAVGGDGTVSEVAAGLVGSPAALAIIPTGTTNVVARGLGIPLSPAGAARLLLRPTERLHLDIAVSGDRVMLHMAGAGFDALMMRDARHSLKRIAAWAAYVPPAMRHLTGRLWDFTLTVDGELVRARARMILIANGSFVLDPWFKVGQRIRPDDGLLDICIFTPPHLGGTLNVAFWGLLGRVERSRYFRQLQGKVIRLDATPPAPVEIDGDYIGTTPVELRVQPGALPVVVPTGSAVVTERSRVRLIPDRSPRLNPTIRDVREA